MNLVRRILILYLLTVVPAFSQTPLARASLAPVEYEDVRLNKIVSAVRITEKITLDGQLQERAWKLAIPATDFIQKAPHPGEPSPERTEVRFLYDDDNLYVGVNSYESEPGHTAIKELKEDFDMNGTDLIQLIIDSLHDRRSGFTFVVNPAGAKRDSQLSNNGIVNNDWDGVWDAKVSRNDEGWIIEYMIPFKTLRFSNASTQEWGVNISRKILHRNEESNWAPVPIRFTATRTALAGTLRGLENIHQGRNLKFKPFVIARTTQARTGNELRTTQSFTRLKDYDGGFDAKFSLTPSLTLDTTYRTDFAQVEVDQQQVNLTRFNLFFPEKRDFFLENQGTFNFGPGGNLVPFFSRRIGLSSAGTPVPIVGGTRVSGKVSGYDVGFLGMKTERLGITPSSNYLVGRVKRNFLRNSWAGALVTHRDSTLPGDYNRVYGTDAHLEFNKLEFDSYILRSDSPGKSGKNQARRFETGWRGDELTVSAEYNAVQTNFNPEVGFVRRGDSTQYSGDFAWRPQLKKSDLIRNLNFGSNVDYYEGANGKVETRTQGATLGVQFENNGSVNFDVNETFDRLVKDFPIRSTISIPAGDYKYLSYTARFNTSQNQPVVANGNVNWGEFWNGHNKSITGNLSFRPSYHMNFEFNYSHNHVDLPNGSFTSKLIGPKFLYAFTSRAFFNAFIQYNVDTHQVSSNIRFNITHHPLSDLYIVYNDRRDTVTHQLMERAFIVKLTNLFNF